jgi:phosphoribosylglycinamide formyltransferase-1
LCSHAEDSAELKKGKENGTRLPFRFSSLGNGVRIAVLGSGAGSNFVGLYEQVTAGEVVLVISDQKDAGILKKAQERGVVAIYEGGGKNWPERVAAALKEARVDWICLAGLMRVIREPLLSQYKNRILNIHPSLLPLYPGKEAWKQALVDGATETGCTVHLVDAGIDTGKIMKQRVIPVLPDDTAETLHARIQVEEREIFAEVVNELLSEK